MSRRLLLAAVLLLIAAAFITPFQRDLFVGDETKYGEVVREMRTTGAFFLPTLNGTPFTHKPPVHFWLIDLLTFPLGLYSTWAFVIPSLLGFAFLLWLLTRMRDWLAAFVCGTSGLVWGSAQTARMDISFTAFLTLACWLLFRFFESTDPRPAERGEGGRRTGEWPRHLLYASIAIAIATLIKGPMAPVIALVLFGLECWRRRRMPRANYLPALAALILIPLLWLVPAILLGGNSYAHDVIVKQTVGRAFSTWVHKEGPWFYLVHSPLDLFPWFCAAIAAIVAAWKKNDPLDRFCISWILAVLLPYSLMSSKLDVYMMAMIPPVALLITEYVSSWECGRPARWCNALSIAIMALIGIAALVVTPQMIKGPEGALVQLP